MSSERATKGPIVAWEAQETSVVPPAASSPVEFAPSGWSRLVREEDWLANWSGLLMLLVVVVVVIAGLNETFILPGKWKTDGVREAFSLGHAFGMPLVLIALTLFSTVSQQLHRAKKKPVPDPIASFVPAFIVVWLFTFCALWLGRQKDLSSIGFGYALWSLLFGMLLTNALSLFKKGKAFLKWLQPALREGTYIKTGLVLLGVDIQIVGTVGGPGLLVSYLIPPFVILIMWFFGTRILRIHSKTLVITLAAGCAVCGNSAATAVAAACRAPKDELPVVIGILTVFTVIFMLVEPYVAIVTGMPSLVAGAWIGGSVDHTAQVLAAGAIVGDEAEVVAGVVKILQNTLIGFVSLGVAFYWVLVVEKEPVGAEPEDKGETTLRVIPEVPSLPPLGNNEETPSEKQSSTMQPPLRRQQPSLSDLWRRFPVFTLGFLAHSLVLSFLIVPFLSSGQTEVITSSTKSLSSWMFALAFVTIGLDTNLRELREKLHGGRIIALYVVGQLFDVLVTLLVAYLAFSGWLWAPPQLS